MIFSALACCWLSNSGIIVHPWGRLSFFSPLKLRFMTHVCWCAGITSDARLIKMTWIMRMPECICSWKFNVGVFGLCHLYLALASLERLLSIKALWNTGERFVFCKLFFNVEVNFSDLESFIFGQVTLKRFFGEAPVCGSLSPPPLCIPLQYWPTPLDCALTWQLALIPWCKRC